MDPYRWAQWLELSYVTDNSGRYPFQKLLELPVNHALP